ncbi:hypothetical protein MKZ38_004320 [Zalerion maritima]|uniref:Uncharacterized protein n=1 Tax=Zalerion maritima TaxID=339359 RepID=A0AAD5RLF8_9PEZI|nr:hypothetical protein MKZ38_004320 [Zalerion maritima]
MVKFPVASLFSTASLGCPKNIFLHPLIIDHLLTPLHKSKQHRKQITKIRSQSKYQDTQTPNSALTPAIEFVVGHLKTCGIRVVVNPAEGPSKRKRGETNEEWMDRGVAVAVVCADSKVKSH